MADAANERKQDAYRQLKEMEKDVKRFKIEEELVSDDSLILEHETRKRQKPLIERTPIQPEKFPSKYYNRWRNWVRHFKAVAKANGWTGSKKSAAKPTCVISWALEEFDTVPRRYVDKEPGCHPPPLMNSVKFENPKCSNIAASEPRGQDLQQITMRKRRFKGLFNKGTPARRHSFPRKTPPRA